MSSTKRTIYEGYKTLYNAVTPVKLSAPSTLAETGKMTPEEFVVAGDMFVQTLPDWEWCSGELQPFLPKDKKYLKCTCYSNERIPEIECDFKILGKDDVVHDGDWVEASNDIDEWAIAGSVQTSVPTTIATTTATTTTTATATATATTTKAKNDDLWGTDDDDDDAKAPQHTQSPLLRCYTVTILYDVYYSTPRIYIHGYDSKGVLLTGDQMMEDVSKEHRGQTVSIDAHPHLNTPAISIHPCRHAETIRARISKYTKYMQEEQRKNNEPVTAITYPIHYILFVFVKLIDSVVPTIHLPTIAYSDIHQIE